MINLNELRDYRSLGDTDELERRAKQAAMDKRKQLEQEPTTMDWFTSAEPYGRALKSLGQSRYSDDSIGRNTFDAIGDFMTGQGAADRRLEEIQERQRIESLPTAERNAAIMDKSITQATDTIGVGMLAGPRAIGADLGKLAEAKSLATAKTRSGVDIGAGRDLTRVKTGWHEQAPGDWVYEIPDTGFKPKGGAVNPLASTMGEAYEHPEAYKAYPELANMPFKMDVLPGNTLGEYNPKAAGDRHGVKVSMETSPETMDTTVLHEAFGHGVQDIENRVGGTNLGSADAYKQIKISGLEDDIAMTTKDKHYKQILKENLTKELGDRDYSRMSMMDKSKLRTAATEKTQEQFGIDRMRKTKQEMEDTSSHAIYESDWGETESRTIENRLKAIKALREQGLTDAQIDQKVLNSPFKYDIDPDKLIDVGGTVEEYKRRSGI